MMLDLCQVNQIFLVCGKTDLRKGIDGLANVVQQRFELDSYQKTLFLFCGSRKDRFKGFLWAGDGFLLLYKRLEDGRLQWPSDQAAVRKLQPKQLDDLLQQLRNANQKIKNLQRKLFAPKSDKITAEQLPFFELESCFSAENNSPVNTVQETVMVPVKKKRHRKRSDSFSADLPTEIVVNKLTDQACHLDSRYKTIKVGLKHVRDEVKYIPAQVKIVKYYQETYQYLICSKLAGKNAFYYQDMVRALFSYSYATPL